MIRFLPHEKIEHATIAVSGGVDSMAVLDFMRRKHEVSAVHINHNEGNSNQAEDLVSEFCDKNHIDLMVFKANRDKYKWESTEEYWRNLRYEIFHSYESPIITAHNLDDCVETWIWSSLHGNPSIIPYRNKNVIRPFRANPKREFEKWCLKNNIKWIDDSSNLDYSLTRNYIRNVMMPHVLHVNSGISKVIKKKVMGEQEFS